MSQCFIYRENLICDPTNRGWCSRETWSRGRLNDVVDLDECLSFGQMRMRGGFVQRQDWRDTCVDSSEGLAPFIPGLQLKTLLQESMQAAPIPDILSIGQFIAPKPQIGAEKIVEFWLESANREVFAI